MVHSLRRSYRRSGTDEAGLFAPGGDRDGFGDQGGDGTSDGGTGDGDGGGGGSE